MESTKLKVCQSPGLISHKGDEPNTNLNTRQDFEIKAESCESSPGLLVEKAPISDSDSDLETHAEENSDNFLGRLRKGMNLIENYARETMAQCDTEESRQDMAERLEKSHLGMLRAEKSMLSTTRIISEIVDEFASDFEEDDVLNDNDDNLGTGFGDEGALKPEKKSAIPILFRGTGGSSIRKYGSMMSQVMRERMANYNDGLTDDVLKSERKFRTLRAQIIAGKQDSENNNPKTIEMELSVRGGGDYDLDLAEVNQDPDCDSNSKTNIRIESDDEDEEYDEAVLPCTDPITLKPILTAVRNKLCNHVFDTASIAHFMREHPDATCPMYGCRNEKALREEDLFHDAGLTRKIRQKNAKLA